MKNFKSFLMAILLLFWCINFSNAAFAEPQEISAEGQYRLGDSDSRDTAKKAALAEAKRKIIEQAGVFVESYTEVNDFQVSKDQIKTTAKSMIKIKSEEVNFSENGTLCTALVVAIIDIDNIGRTLETEISKSNNTGDKIYTDGDIKVSNVKSGNAYIPRNTKITAELGGTFSSKDTMKGDAIPFRLVGDLVINDVVVAKAGTEIKAICNYRKKVNLFGGGALQFRMISFKTINGKVVPLKSTMPVYNISTDFKTTNAYFAYRDATWNEGAKFRAKVSDDTDLNVTWSELAEMEDDI